MIPFLVSAFFWCDNAISNVLQLVLDKRAKLALRARLLDKQQSREGNAP